MNSDFVDLLRLFAAHEVRYLIVGGYAAMRYSQPRFTKDLDVWIEPSMENARRLTAAFSEFGMPMIDVIPEDFSREGLQYMVGRTPVLFDFLTSLPEMNFAQCWENRTSEQEAGFAIHYLGVNDLIRAKLVANRPQDLMDISEIKRAQESKSPPNSSV
jgi:hypothetical protein